MLLSKILSKYQITLPKQAVKALGLSKGDVLKCTVDKGSVSFTPMVVEEAYTEEEMQKFYKLYADPANKGKSFKTRTGAMAYLKSLHAHR